MAYDLAQAHQHEGEIRVKRVVRRRLEEPRPVSKARAQTDLVLISTAIRTGDRWPVGCALLVVVILSLRPNAGS